MFGIGNFAVGRRARLLVVLLYGVLVASAVLASGAQADVSITVGGSCTLNKAVLYADGTAEPACSSAVPTGTTTIDVPAGTYMITGTLQITRATAIVGAGVTATTISGGGTMRVFDIGPNVQARISGALITGGSSPAPTCGSSCSPQAGSDGGGILNDGTLTVANVDIIGNSASAGLAGNAGVMLCTTGCPAVPGQNGGHGGNGGGIANDGNLTVIDSTFANDTAGAGAAGTRGSSGTGSDDSAGQNGGNGGDGGAGGGIYNAPGATATISGSLVDVDAAGAGGNGGNGSTATLNNTNGGTGGAAGNGGLGGGIANLGTLILTTSTIATNTGGAGGNGGAGGSGLGSGSGGSGGDGGVGGNGGGIAATGSAIVDTTILQNDTIAANSTRTGGTGGFISGVPGVGAGVFSSAAAQVTLGFVTVAGNANNGSAGPYGSGIYVASGTVEAAGSIVSGNGGGAQGNCDGSVTDGGHNVAYQAGSSGGCPGIVGDPKLGTLGPNGDPAQTMALGAGSAAANVVPLAACSVTTDQRGVPRPQGGACDAGAYQVAPPAIGAAAASADGRVTANVNPNLQDSSVMIRWGKSSAYGYSTPAQDIGAGTSNVAISVGLGGLQKGVTYHAQIVATNHDGTSTSSDLTFTANAAAAGSGATTQLVKLSTSGPKLSLRLACAGGASGAVCDVHVAVTVRETIVHGRITAVAARAARTSKIRTVTIGRASTTLGTGQSKTVSLKLNATGRSLLLARHRLPAAVTISGTTKITRHTTFKGSRPKKRA
jgi:hypothetical protein